MKKKNKILLTILIVFIIMTVALGILAYINRNIIATTYYIFTSQSQDLEKEKEESDKRAKEAIKEFGIEEITPLTEEETEMLKNGEMSRDEAIDIVLGKNKDNNPEKDAEKSSEQSDEENKNEGKNSNSQSDGNKETTAGGGNKENTSTSTNSSNGSGKPQEQGKADATQSADYKEKNDEISRLIGELYVLKSQFSGELSVIEDWVNSEYRKYTAQYGEGNIPSSIKMKVGKRAYADALALEDSCDAKVYAILDRIEVLLKETGQSTALVSEMKSAYDSEKKAAISYYMSQF